MYLNAETMPRRSMRRKNAHAIPRNYNRFVTASPALEAESVSTAEIETSDDNATAFEFFDDWWVVHPTYTVNGNDGGNKRSLVYTGDSMRTRQRQKSADGQALKA
ncbi:hypothetical protein Ae201684P_001968 [Aphanomyces euteiches]|uniref:Uncharacterized protein n=1 Tax=Aphanomyces euteiches TaxID=100861 RepID=A0A6G0XK83_9STRA|nr:hypothetical protein Ae201684_003970 [Aphanomyces euteiches]KAH9084728.1 hypothetical protein Ae201684P_001968 [Aphanomyces euteiches]